MRVLRYKMPPFPNLAADDDVSHTESFPTSIKVGRSTKVVCFPEFFFLCEVIYSTKNGVYWWVGSCNSLSTGKCFCMSLKAACF